MLELVLDADKYSFDDLHHTLSKHPNLFVHQRMEMEDFDDLSPEFKEDEFTEKTTFERQRSDPYLSNHHVLVHKISKRLYNMSHGDYRICIQCQSKVYWYESHDICLSSQESADTVASNSSKRMNTSIDVHVVEDPGLLNSLLVRRPRQIILENPSLWTPFIIQMHLNMTQYLINDKSEELLNCRHDDDWSALTISSGLFVSCVEHVMTQQLVKIQSSGDLKGIDFGEDYRKIFECLCGIFCLKRIEIEELEDINAFEMSSLRKGANVGYIVNIYIRTHQKIIDLCSREDFVHFWTSNYKLLLDDGKWSFEKLLRSDE